MNVLAKSLKKNQEYMKSLVDNGFFFILFYLINHSIILINSFIIMWTNGKK